MKKSILIWVVALGFLMIAVGSANAGQQTCVDRLFAQDEDEDYIVGFLCSGTEIEPDGDVVTITDECTCFATFTGPAGDWALLSFISGPSAQCRCTDNDKGNAYLCTSTAGFATTGIVSGNGRFIEQSNTTYYGPGSATFTCVYDESCEDLCD